MMAFAKQESSRDHRGDILAIGALLVFVYIATLVFVLVYKQIKIDPVVLVLVSTVVSAAIMLPTAVYAFQFGSSKGSQDKNQQIAALTPPVVAPPPDQTSPAAAAGLVISQG